MTTENNPAAKPAQPAKPKKRSLADRYRALPQWSRFLWVMGGVIVLFYLPDLGDIPGTNLEIPGLSLLRTDQGTTGTDWDSILFRCAVFVLIAIGLNVVVGLAGLLDLGYVGFFAIGAYSVALFGSLQSPVVKILQKQFNLSPEWALSWSWCILAAIVFTMISGVLLGWPTLRLRGDYLAIVTLGFGEIIRIVARNSTITGGPDGIAAIPGPEGKPSVENEFFTLTDQRYWYYLAISVVILIIFAVRLLENSRVGRSWLAIREDEDAAAVMGVHGFKFKLWAFAIGAAIGGLSGLLFASQQAFIDPSQFNVNLSILFVAMVVVGGAGNMAGAALGAILLTYLPERLRSLGVLEFLPEQFRDPAKFRYLLFGVAMVLVMILRPQGLLPSRRRARELKDRAQEVPVNG
jgi:branched-chain amino acid transport system permease protein